MKHNSARRANTMEFPIGKFAMGSNTMVKTIYSRWRPYPWKGLLKSTCFSQTVKQLSRFALSLATRRQLTVKRRYSAFKKFPLKKRPVSLQSVLPSIGDSKRELNYSLAQGLAWKVSCLMWFIKYHCTIQPCPSIALSMTKIPVLSKSTQ